MTDYNIEYKDHIVENPNRFRQTVVAPGIVDLVPIWVENPSQVIQEGTPVNADLFDKLRANVTRRSETFAATASQTVFNLTKAYLVGQGRLDVYISGVKQRSGIDFTETNPTRFTLSEGLDAGTVVEAVYFSASQALSEDLIEQVQAAEAATIAANDAADEANDAATGALTANLNWKEPVNNLTALNALASPQARDTRQTKDTGNVYRYDGSAWVLIQTMDPNAINALDTRITTQLAEKANQLQVYMSQSNATRYFAHRGASNVAPENTMAAFEFAGELGFAGIETDTWRTSDGVWVCIHDETVDRTTNGTGTVTALTSTYINSLTIDGGLNVALYDGLKVPTLEQYMRVCKKYNCVAAVEVKGTGASAYLHEIIDMARELGMYNQLHLIIGDQATATALRAIDKNVIIHHLTGTSQASIDFVKGLGNTVAAMVYTAITPAVVESFHAEGIPLSTYGMSTLSQILELLSKNVDFIIADNHGGDVK
ncbi:glycerophosphodiester phosphodiesterase family protein [Exiguobacterium sp. s5]|uniref:glycerophosphodiester phosphodiesterase n=1 Tax=Exiguobacterium sp. s5 TaxID=2751239 RepID=UPI001BE824C1|nr:glycerophosphodiester phosphodiesterase family protein [Exiguobacterium sp. s5]